MPAVATEHEKLMISRAFLTPTWTSSVPSPVVLSGDFTHVGTVKPSDKDDQEVLLKRQERIERARLFWAKASKSKKSKFWPSRRWSKRSSTPIKSSVPSLSSQARYVDWSR